jgi:methionine-rich copper-binding protein CopC
VTPATPPKVGVAGVRRACVSSSFHVRFSIATSSSVKSVVVKLDGKRIKSTTKGSFTLTINGRKLKSGRHRLTITATDSAGHVTTTHKSFSVCKAAKPRRKAAPRFTG